MAESQLIGHVISELQKKMLINNLTSGSIDIAKFEKAEFVGLEAGDTIGLVIANVDESIRSRLGIDKRYRSLGILGSRSGPGPQAIAADEAVKATNSELIMFELPRDTRGQGGHGVLMAFGAEEVSDAQQAVEVALKTMKWAFGGVHMGEIGYTVNQYTARASYALEKYFKATLGKAWACMVSCPAAIGIVASDAAVKSAHVQVAMQMRPTVNSSHSNEFGIMITGDSGAVKQAAITGREVALKLLAEMGDCPNPQAPPYF